MAIIEDIRRTDPGAHPWSRQEKADAAAIALAFAAASSAVGALITEALSQLF